MMDALVSGEISELPQPYIRILKEEPRIAGNLNLVLYDLITVAIEDGMYRHFMIELRL